MTCCNYESDQSPQKRRPICDGDVDGRQWQLLSIDYRSEDADSGLMVYIACLESSPMCALNVNTMSDAVDACPRSGRCRVDNSATPWSGTFVYVGVSVKTLQI
jgi:hypothetical protein